MKDLIYKNINEFITPAGKFTITSAFQNSKFLQEKINFSVSKNTTHYDYEILDKNDHVIDKLNPDAGYDIIIDKNSLELKKLYSFQFSEGENWDFLCSDESYEAYGCVINNYLIGFGTADYNEEEKFLQKVYDENKFTDYTFYMHADNNGFDFKYLDTIYQNYIYIPVAWIKLGKYDLEDYKEMLGMWLT